jgi:hypothetical protein
MHSSRFEQYFVGWQYIQILYVIPVSNSVHNGAQNYGAPDLVTATFVQRPTWLAKKFQFFLPSFKVKIVPHTLFLPKKLFYAVINVLYTPIWSLELLVRDGLLGKP